MDKKFIAIFVLLILIPFGFLSYFIFRIIYYQEELEKRRIYNQQKILVEQIHNNFRQQIINKYRYFYELSNKIDINFSSLMKKSLENRRNGIKIIFFMNTSGQLIFPNYVDFEKSSEIFQPFTNEFNKIMREIKELERKEDYRNGILKCERFIKQYNNKFPAFYIAQLKYEVAKFYFKLKKFQKAISISREISSRYSYLLNNDGIPFLFLTSLLIGKSLIEMNKSEEAVKIFSDALDSFWNGELILTNTCSVLLKELKGILEEIKASESLIYKVDFLINEVSFGKIFFSKIEKALSRYLTSPSQEVEFLISDPGEPQALVLYFPLERGNIKGLIGFEYDLNQIVEELINNIKSEDLYIEVGEERRNLKSKLIHAEILSPLSPRFKIFISLRSKTFSQFQKLKFFLISAIILLFFTTLIFGIFMIMRDVSRKMELSRLRSEFISNVTHELKAPLSSIRLFVETLMLDRVRNRAERKKYLSIIMNETQRLSRLINNVLDFSKIETGQKDFYFKEMDIREVVKEVIKLFDYELKREKFKLKLDLPKEPVLILIDRDAIYQLFINLISNAIKFSEDVKEISIILKKQKNELKIKVEDKGIGIPEEDLPYIFDKFYRVKNEKTKGKIGAGIGLSLVKHIVEAHGGKIKVKSKEGKGTIFIINLPILRNF